MPEPKLSREEFKVLVTLSGLPLDEAKKSELYIAYGHLERMKERVRMAGERPRDAEPAHVFHPIGRGRDR